MVEKRDKILFRGLKSVYRGESLKKSWKWIYAACFFYSKSTRIGQFLQRMEAKRGRRKKQLTYKLRMCSFSCVTEFFEMGISKSIFSIKRRNPWEFPSTRSII